MNNIYAKDTCELFRKISKSVWDKIIFNHSVDTEVSEIGLTNDIIATLRNYSNRKKNIGIWANKGDKEKLYGSDIDIFIEKGFGQFVWYAMQAKVLRLNGGYDDVDTKRNGEYQWDKLKRLKKLTACETKYLFYNGVQDFSYSSKDFCKKRFQSHQFGCSIADSEKVKKIMLDPTKFCINKLLNEKFPHFKDFHPSIASPWREIVCCNINEDSKLFLPIQIATALKQYKKLSKEKFFSTNIFDNIQNASISYETLNIISSSNEEVGRKPRIAIVVKKRTK